MKRKRKPQENQAVTRISPQEFASAYRDLLSPEDYDQLIEEVQKPLPPAIRINPLKTDSAFPSRLSAKYGWQLEAIPFCPTGFRILNAAPALVSATLEHHLGRYYIQEAASMLPVELFSPLMEDEIILDMAASPGGKTTHLISRSGDRGLVLANDSSAGRIQALRMVLQQWGSVSHAITRFPAEHFGEWYPGVFDKVLLDAPCSMQGLRTAESHPVRPVSEKESLQLSIRQRAMLTSAIHSLRVGGEVVYSTCTLLPQEDEMVVEAILKQFGAVLHVLDVAKSHSIIAPALTTYQGERFSPETMKALRLWPFLYQTAGFFACIFQKVDETHPISIPPPERPLERAGFEALSYSRQNEFCEKFYEMYGYDLSKDLKENRWSLVKRFEQIHLFPDLLLEKFSGLPLQGAGMLLGEETPPGFLPSHSWVSRFAGSCTRNRFQLNEKQSEAWMEGKNLEVQLQSDPGKSPYRVILNSEGMPIGRARVTSQGLKNLFPRGLK